MNRHARRAAAAKNPSGVSGISELVAVAEKLQPYLAQMAELKSQLQSTTQLLRSLQKAIGEQEDVFLRMFAKGMDVPLATVLQMKAEIQHALESSQQISEA